MITVLLVSRDDRWRARLEAAVPESSIFSVADDAAALRHVRRIETDVVFFTRDCVGHVERFVERVHDALPDCVTIAVADDSESLTTDFVIEESAPDRRVDTVMRQATDRRRLLRELAVLRARPGTPSGAMPVGEGHPRRSAKLLKNFTRILAAGFDLPRTLEMFVDAVVELLRPARLGLLMPEGDGRTFRLRVHRGFAPPIVESLRLSSDHGLCAWLTVEGRPARAGDVADAQVAREMSLLQATVAVPLLARGELVAALVVGPPLVRSAYAAREIETLFDLGTHIAGAIHAISLHHRLQRANEFNQRILEHMASGVITMGADERIGSINRRAAEILEVDPHEIVGHDLRVLPSPLGDMLYEASKTGRPKPPAEIRLALRGLWLQASTYPIRGDETTGAVLMFDDVTAEKELAAQKLQAEQFDLLTRVVARIADEIKNPLVSINTFMELIEERFDDADFRKRFAGVVGRDVRRVVQVFEKLTGLVTHDELNFTTVDVHTVVDDAVATVRMSDDVTRVPLEVHVTRDAAPAPVKVDPAQFRKALCYLIWYLAHHSSERAMVSVSIARQSDDKAPDDVRIVVASRTAQVSARELDRLFDPVRLVQENLIDIGPAVSQRIVEATGGRLTVREGRSDIAFVVQLPVAV